ncbi:hypothetical protein [Paenibacillus naphthalenovorans]|uniref:hypothetical protein n=1 Tax=Paenibacillus naphthalenovorans TaxID=162209 RepID=UPI003D2817F1
MRVHFRSCAESKCKRDKPDQEREQEGEFNNYDEVAIMNRDDRFCHLQRERCPGMPGAVGIIGAMIAGFAGGWIGALLPCSWRLSSADLPSTGCYRSSMIRLPGRSLG